MSASCFLLLICNHSPPAVVVIYMNPKAVVALLEALVVRPPTAAVHQLAHPVQEPPSVVIKPPVVCPCATRTPVEHRILMEVPRRLQVSVALRRMALVTRPLGILRGRQGPSHRIAVDGVAQENGRWCICTYHVRHDVAGCVLYVSLV